MPAPSKQHCRSISVRPPWPPFTPQGLFFVSLIEREAERMIGAVLSDLARERGPHVVYRHPDVRLLG